MAMLSGKLKFSRFATRAWLPVVLLVSVSLLSGCIATGIRVGPVFIPIDTSIGKDKQPPKPEGSAETQTEQQADLYQCGSPDGDQSSSQQTAQCKPKNEPEKKYPFEKDDSEIHF